ncbi:hypothetical protein [Floricoccus tropicus]|uniref:hypothetical protein n=1 Tax=Floricoccus tropicus TaxID=1859473 RepID=UPI0013011B6D|nr:hypothetical protein [Floricoccus tropicus]
MKRIVAIIGLILLIFTFGMMVYSFINPAVGRYWMAIFFAVAVLLLILIRINNGSKK